MQQVLLNLVLNSRDAMPRGGHLIIETRDVPAGDLTEEQRPTLPPGAYSRLTLTDTGEGMSPEIQQRIFEPFFTTKAGKGTGLGLATVYGIVNKWNGHIFVHSNPGMGTTFALYFPSLQGAHDRAEKPKPTASLGQGSETILLAEDEDPVRKILVRTLSQHGYKVLDAANGIEAVKKSWAHEGTIHLLLTDTVMPKMNGKELADELRKARPQIKVVFMSGYPREILSQQGVLDPGITLIQKPFELDELMRQVRQVLDGEA
jgi:two-component system, cell cycle sensor histidine kinase and response regulator CckA